MRPHDDNETLRLLDGLAALVQSMAANSEHEDEARHISAAVADLCNRRGVYCLDDEDGLTAGERKRHDAIMARISDPNDPLIVAEPHTT